MKKSLVELLKNVEQHFAQPSNSHAEFLSHAPLADYEYSLYHIKEVTFDEDSPRKQAFENVLNTLSMEGILFTYLVMGDENGVSFYFGIAKDQHYRKGIALEVDDIGEAILKPAIESNFRGSVVSKLSRAERTEVKQRLASYQQVAKLEGVPSVNEENEEFQGIDRLVDMMSGDNFCLAIIADPLSLPEICQIENELHKIYDKLQPIAKKSEQTSRNQSTTEGKNEGTSTSKNTGTSENVTFTKTDGKNDSVTKGTSTSEGKSNGGSSSSSNSGNSTNQSRTEGSNTGTSEAKSKGTSTGDSTSINVGTNTSTQHGTSESTTLEFSDKLLQEWLNYIDEILLKRVQYGKNKGLYLSGVYLFAETSGSVIKLGNTARALFSGGENNKSPLNFVRVTQQAEIDAVCNFQFPRFKGLNTLMSFDNQSQFDLLHSKNPLHQSVGHWLSTNELSVIAGLPQKEVVGLTLKEEVEFGLNLSKKVEPENQLYLGHLVKSGLPQSMKVNINKLDLDKHTFIAGVTGSGKTTTCQRLLESAQIPFLVIEPAKTEYRVLTKKNPNILIFTLGNDNVAPFRLNPFEFFPHENITSRVDMIKASIESAFDMEAAIPQLIEAAIYRSYEAKGWNIATSKNRHYENPFANGVHAFPTLSELVAMTEVVVSEQGFDDRLKQDYIGSIKARLQGLLVGAKGLMLDTPRSIDFQDLATRNVILELEEIRNPSEKSLIMGFILANLNEAIRANYSLYRQRGERFKHITLIEEAHRLLSKFEAGDSANKKQGVEAFADMLAEVRKYGEALIIVDQIPNKLTPEVLKNTNTKIIHKLFAQDDKDAVGNTMALSDEQKGFLSNLEPGRVVLSSSSLHKPVQVQIEELVSTTNEEDVEPAQIRALALNYYAQTYQRGVITGLDSLNEQPSAELVEMFLSEELAAEWRQSVDERKITPRCLTLIQNKSVEHVIAYLNGKCYLVNNDTALRTPVMQEYFSQIQSNSGTGWGLALDNVVRPNLKK